MQLFSFNYCASRNVIIPQRCALKRNSFDAHLRQQQRRKHQYPNYDIINIWCVVTLSISRVCSICINHRNHRNTSSCWIVMSARCIPCCHWHKCDVTECQSRPWVVTRGRSVLVESFVTILALNLSPNRLIVETLFSTVWISALCRP